MFSSKEYKLKFMTLAACCLAGATGCENQSEKFVSDYAASKFHIGAERTWNSTENIQLVTIRNNQNDFETLLPHFASLDSLLALQLSHIRPSSAHIKGISRLTILNLGLSVCAINNEDLKQISVMSELEAIDLFDETFDDNGVAHLANMESLKLLNLHAPQVNGTAFATGFRSVERLELEGCDITDEGLQAISNLKSLKRLQFKSEKVTYLGVLHLTNVHQLRHLEGVGGGYQSKKGCTCVRCLSRRDVLPRKNK